MKQIKVNPNNEKFYSKEFIRGFNLGAKRQYEADIADMPKWIPCSERLPSKGVAVLVNGTMYDAPPITISTDAPYYYEKGWINAWMPLPKVWEGEGDD